MLMSFPFLIWLLIFAYVPLWGWIMAFQNYRPHLGVFGSEFVGLMHFERLYNDQLFHDAIRNTIGQSIYLLVLGFTAPIAFAILLNEVRHLRFKKAAQTISYLPYFVSWVVTASIITMTLAHNGSLNALLLRLGLIETSIGFLGIGRYFWSIMAIADTWKNVGWNAIIYLAAIASIDPTLYEAAEVDGAGRWRKIWHITLPSIKTIIIVLLVLNIGQVLNIGFERQMLLGNPLTQEYHMTIDYYALDYGFAMARFSYGTAVGIFKSVISLSLLVTANKIARTVEAGVF
jgi:putative aldouronate transport system permease protein